LADFASCKLLTKLLCNRDGWEVLDVSIQVMWQVRILPIAFYTYGERRMKQILCLCDAGMHRSVAMAYVLRKRGHFVVSGSYDNFLTSPGYWQTKYDDNPRQVKALWDKIIFMQEGGEHFIGRDEYNDCMHPELLAKCEELANKLEL
jgi:hypothetical protein